MFYEPFFLRKTFELYGIVYTPFNAVFPENDYI